MKRQRDVVGSVAFLVLLTSQLVGQTLCDGNLGSNIFEQGDFGSGVANVVTDDPGIAPGYLYDNTPSPPDGSYTITNNTAEWSLLFPTWLQIEDNSADPDGYMMVVNASNEPGLFYEEQVEGLCENTLYQFSADIINIVRTGVANHILPNVDFLIDDISQFSTGDIAQDERWNTYGFTFTTEPGQSSVKLSLRNNAPGGGGNDLALDNISFRACGPNAFINAEQVLFVCSDANVPTDIIAEINSSEQAIQWQFSLDSLVWQDIDGAFSDTHTHELFEVGSYYYRYLTAGTDVELANEKCRIFSDVLKIEVLPIVYEIKDTTCVGFPFMFGDEAIELSGTYQESYISSRGCDSIVDLELTVIPYQMPRIEWFVEHPSCFGYSDGSIGYDLESIYPSYSIILNGEIISGPFVSDLSAGEYHFEIADRYGCGFSETIELIEPEELKVSLPRDTTLDLGTTIDISAEADYDVNMTTWTSVQDIDCDNCLEVQYLALVDDELRLIAFDENGCSDTATMYITVNRENLPIYLPNILNLNSISPDNTFVIGELEGMVSEVVDFSVFDRWGGLVHNYKGTDLVLWDGRSSDKEVLPGVYVYALDLRLIDGEIYSFSGELTVIR